MPATYTIVTALPPCDFHTISGSICQGAPDHVARFDGATNRGGPWATMCEDAFRLYGVGVGVGLGQVLILKHETPPDPTLCAAVVIRPSGCRP